MGNSILTSRGFIPCGGLGQKRAAERTRPFRGSRVRGILAVSGATLSAFGAVLFLAFAATTMSSTATEAQSRDAYCRAYARDVSARLTRGGAVGGAIRGGTGGAVIGGIVDGKSGARKGARIGGTTGAIVGAANRGATYDALYRDCMRGLIYY
jgi:hypothetical protein